MTNSSRWPSAAHDFAGSARARVPVTVPILLDTDLGTDADDALALAFLARDPRVHLLGVTTVNGDTRRRAALTRALLGLAGRPDVSVGVGAADPMAGTPSKSMPVGLVARGPAADLPTPVPSAEEVIVAALRSSREPVHVCAIGAATNVAAVLSAHPDLLDKVAGVHLMSGCLRRYALVPGGREFAPIAEFNLNGDAVAVAVCLGLPVPLRIVPLDVTNVLLLTPEDRATIAAAGPLGAALDDQMESWLRLLRSGSDDPDLAQVRLHDPLAVIGVVDPAVESSELARLSLVGGPGDAFFVESAVGRPVSVVRSADAARLRMQLVRTIAGSD